MYLDVSALRFAEHGAELLHGAVDAQAIAAIEGDFASIANSRPGARASRPSANVMQFVGREGSLGRIASSLADLPGPAMRPVRIVLFDKTPDTNWSVPWHQDRTIAVAGRHDVQGFANWNIKDGVDHVEPPIALLSRMLTLRLHVDDAGDDNGPLDILPGSHRLGRVPAADVAAAVSEGTAIRCVAFAGDVLAMRLTVLHKSDRSASPRRRRVLHVDYSPDELPPPLRWYIRADA